MLPFEFFGQNIHFAISLFAALVFFAVFWLQLDAWLAKRSVKELCKWVGFLLVALSFVVSATTVEQSVLGESTLANIAEILTFILRGLGLACIVIGQILDPLQQVPITSGLAKKDFKKHHAVGLTSAANLSHLLLPIGALSVAWLYWRRATTGLERHYKPVAISFALLAAYQTVALTSFWQNSANPLIAQRVAAFGPIWLLEQALLLSSVIVLGHWVWQYLTRRFMSQLFIIFTSVTLAIFLLTTVSFTYLLVHDIQKASLGNLQTAANVLGYAVESKKSEISANTTAIAENPEIAAAIAAKDHKALVTLMDDFLRDKKLSSLVLTNVSGQVLLRAEDPERFGDSLSSDTLVRRALIGQASSSVSSREGILAPLVYIKSAVPIRAADHTIVGTATASLIADTTFVDGIKKTTGLDSAIYAGKVRSASTFLTPGGTSRSIGVKETNKTVLATVLTKNTSFKGPVSVENRRYLAVYTPLRDVDNSVIGMLFIGEPQTTVLKAAAHSIQLTFIVTATFLLLSILPAYFMSRYIAGQL